MHGHFARQEIRVVPFYDFSSSRFAFVANTFVANTLLLAFLIRKDYLSPAVSGYVFSIRGSGNKFCSKPSLGF